MTILTDGLISAWQLDGNGGGRELAAPDLATMPPPDPPTWVHLQRDQADAARWLAEVAEVPEDVREALLVEDTRPRCEGFHGGLLINLRGVNLNPGAVPEDMLSLRIWIAGGMAITLRRFRLLAVDHLRRALAEGRGPRSLGQLLAELAEGLTERMAPVVADLEEALDGIEDRAGAEAADALSDLRRTAATLRRFVAPQQIALGRLIHLPGDWLTERDRGSLRHTFDTVTRLVEDLDAVRERAGIQSEALRQHQAERTAHAAYLLSVVAALFLPLGFITGLLGINVGGIPGATTAWAFWAVSALLAALALFGWLVLKRFGWFG